MLFLRKSALHLLVISLYGGPHVEIASWKCSAEMPFSKGAIAVIEVEGSLTGDQQKMILYITPSAAKKYNRLFLFCVYCIRL